MRTILVVDDNEINRQMLSQILLGSYNVLEAVDGQDALMILMREYQRISAVLLDIMMPVLDGYGVLKKMQENPVLAQIPIIVITGSTDADSEQTALNLGATDFVTKPFVSSIIMRRLENLVKLRETSSMINTYRRDKLTGLYNREAFYERAAIEIVRKSPGTFVIACIDIDSFKLVNDRYGQGKGDEVISALAHELQTHFVPAGGFCGRISADNFVVIYPLTFISNDRPRYIMNKLNEATSLALDISVGRYIIHDLSLEVSSMYDRAKLAQSTIKGRSDTHFALYDESMRMKIVAEREIVSSMRTALFEEQFEAWFQPQYNHFTGAIVGAEALVRWRHPEKGLIRPSEFISIFERNGFIYEVDKFIWKSVCRILSEWIDDGLMLLPVSVNISRYDLFREDLVDVILDLTKEYEIPHELLRLEITESAFAESTEQVVKIVQCFIDNGFTVEIDDFGSGYSSLNTLKDVPAQILKLDMNFLKGSDNLERGGNIVESIVRMSKWLGMPVIAEGVESRDQADYLASIGCNYIQGYYYAKPMPREDYEKLVASDLCEVQFTKLRTIDNLNNNSFWNPSSMDTIVFNSFVGAACVIEYHDEKSEMLRINPRFAAMLSETMTTEQALSLDWDSHIDEADRDKRLADIRLAIETGNEVCNESRFINLLGDGKSCHLRTIMRVIASTDDRHLLYAYCENLTAQRFAEKKQRDTDKQLQELLKDMPGGFVRILVDTEGNSNLEYLNDSFCRMLGTTVNELMLELHGRFMSIIHPDDLDEATRIFQGNANRSETITTKFRLRTKSGSYIWVQVFARFISAGDDMTYVNAYYADLSGKEQKQLDIRQTIPFVLSAIMDSSENLDFAKDKDFRYICCSPAFAHFAGQTDQNGVIGKTDFELFPPDTAAQFRNDDEALFSSTSSLVNYTEPIPSSDKLQHYSLTSKYVLRDSAGEIVGLYGSGRDITEIRNVYDRLKLLTDNIPGGIASYIVTQGSIRITYFSDGYHKMFGCTREEYEELSSESVFSGIHEDDLPLVHEQLNRLLIDDTPMDCLYRACTSHGIVWVNLRGTTADRRGDSTLVNIVTFDVTAKHLIEEKELATAQRLNAITENVSSGIRAVSFSGTKSTNLFTNSRFYQVHGNTKEYLDDEIRDPFDAVHPADRDYVRRIVTTAVDEGMTDKVEYRVITRTGDIKWLRTTITVSRFVGVQDLVRIYICTDITEAKEAELANLALNDNIKQLMDDTPGGFVRMQLHSGSPPTLIYANIGFAKLLGMTQRDVMKAYANDLSLCINLNDIHRIVGSFDDISRKLNAFSGKCRLILADGKHLWTLIFGRFITMDSGDSILNTYFTDISSEFRREELQKQLLDNLPCGVAVFEYDGKTLTAIHLNRSYNRLVGREFDANKPTDVFSMIHPDDRQTVIDAIRDCTQSDSNIELDLRILCGNMQYKTFHISSCIGTSQDGKTLFYSAYTLNDTAALPAIP